MTAKSSKSAGEGGRMSKPGHNSGKVATPFLGDDPGPTLDFLRGPSPANRRVA